MYSLEVNNAYTPYNNPAKKCDTLIDDGTKGLLQADFWASSQNNNIIYFSKELCGKESKNASIGGDGHLHASSQDFRWESQQTGGSDF